MSNPLAIAATTATLRNLLHAKIPAADSGLADLEVTTQPLDLARKGITKAQLNVFLYQTSVNAAWRNQDIPRQVRPGETAPPPLALNLRYLITAYGRGESDNDAVSHRVMGSAMSVLHDHPLLDPADITAALPGNDLGAQFERLRITQLPASVDELSKLWMIFQTQYRVSAAYEVTVVLIDSRLPVKAPLPVLRRGADDRGAMAVAGLAPVLNEIRLPNLQPAARLGEDIGLAGEQLNAADSVARFINSRFGGNIDLPLRQGSDANELRAHLPDKTEDAQALSRWTPGYYTVALVQQRAGVPPISSNELAFALAPRITVTPLAAAHGNISLTLTCEPRVRDGQRVLLLFGSRQIEPSSIATPANPALPTSLAFLVPDVQLVPDIWVDANAYVVRLRVDGVDSIPVVHAGVPPLPAFDPAQKVAVT